ncbi:PREDICTED: proteoglycan 4 [Myotis davidii]|uniref:proteoglycan 4 n=1 Tax=Myotis davidii TaxID=225400 RepID=UPI000767800D|nr:PREDICTED: proteoglycan 4 [Myotis davidii]
MAMEWKMLPIHLLLLLSVFLIQQVSSQDVSSCAGRCGEGYSRDTPCNCDYNCQLYMECCPDFKKFCTVELSCKGRCSESFERGRECDCDDQCKKYGKCCPDYDDFCEVHSPTSPPSSKAAPPPAGARQPIKSTTKRSPKPTDKKTSKKVIESEEITEEHSVSENQESSSSSSSSSSSIRKIKSSKNSAANKELKKKPKVKDNKKENPKKKPAPEPPVVDEAGSGLEESIPGADFTVRGSDQAIGVNPMLSDETNLCNGRSVDGLTTLANGTLVAFRGHYFWMLNPLSPPSPPRRITEVWGIPSPIDTVFTRCNCDGKTFFFKGSQYWRFTNDVKDPGYPKQIVKGFGGLNGKILAALSIPKYKERPESVYFFKRGGRVQKYTYKQEPNRQCPGRRPALNYPVYGETTQVRRLRFERAIGSHTHTISIQYSRPVRVLYQDKGFLHNEAQTSTLWRGLPSLVTSAISLPNIRKPDGYDYYAFSRDQAYNLNVPSRTARAVTTPSGKTLSNVWYNCP